MNELDMLSQREDWKKTNVEANAIKANIKYLNFCYERMKLWTWQWKTSDWDKS